MLLENPASYSHQYHTYDSYSSSYSHVLGDVNQLSGTSDNEHEIVALDSPASRGSQRCAVQMRNVQTHTDFGSSPYLPSNDPKNKNWLMSKIKKTLGIERNKKKQRVNVGSERPSVPDNPEVVRTSPPPVVQTRAEVTAHVATVHTHGAQPAHSTLPLPAHSAQPAHSALPTTPTAPQPTPEPGLQYEPDTKPKLDIPPPTSPPPPPAMNPALVNQQIFGTQAPVPFPNAGIVPNVPFMWFPFGVPQQGVPPAAPLPLQQQTEPAGRVPKRKKLPGKEHDCVDPSLLSRDLIRHVKRSCGLSSSRSRIAVRAIIDCLEDSISDSTKIQLLSELLVALETPYRAHPREDQDRRKRSRVTTDQDGREVVRKHSCKRSIREEKILMEYLEQVLEILEEMWQHPDKENSTFHMYFNLANQLLETMYNKLSHKPTYEAS